MGGLFTITITYNRGQLCFIIEGYHRQTYSLVTRGLEFIVCHEKDKQGSALPESGFRWKGTTDF